MPAVAEPPLTRRFTALIHREGDLYVARCPELDVVSQGTSVEHAREMLAEAVELYLEHATPEEVSEQLATTVYVTDMRSAVAKLPVRSGAEVCRILAAHDFARVRQKGSHVIMQRDDPRTTIPVPDHNPLARGTLHGIIVKNGLPRSAFE